MTVGQVGLRGDDPRPILIDSLATGGVIHPRRLVKLWTPSWREPSAVNYRKTITADPLIFMLTYLPHHMTMDRGDHLLISPSEWHLAELDRAWATWPAGAVRHFVAAPREGAKTTLYYVGLTLWAVAMGVARFPLAFAHNSGMSEGHLAKIHAELVGNPYGLLSDFPELVPVKATTRDIVTRSGVQISARGMDATSLGISSARNVRPDLILLDDIEPDAEHYSPGQKGKRLGTLLNAVLPMNLDAIVQWVGTVTMYGSLTHDLVRHAAGEETADWIAETGFTASHYRAILDEGTPDERSVWPQKWSLEQLRRMKYPQWPERKPVSRMYALNYDNRPETAGGLYWTADLIRHTPRAISSSYVLTIDGAVTRGEGSALTALAIVGQAPDGRHLTVEWCWAGRIAGWETRDLAHELLAENPTLKDIVVDAGNGGDLWLEILSPEQKRLPADVTVVLGRADKRGSKRTRFEWLLSLYELELIGHRQRLAVEEQMLAYPGPEPVDLIDAVEMGAAYFNGLPMR